jgi:hypothetical protein
VETEMCRPEYSHEMAIADSQAWRVTCEHSHASYRKQCCDHA